MKQNNVPKKALRVIVGIGAPVIAICLALIFFLPGKTPPCIFYELTGLYCVGCGSGRAALALLHGKIYAAFRFNPLMIILLPFLAYYLLKIYVSFVFGRDLLPFPKIRSRWFGITLLVVIIAFWILRNIPIVPFSYLAPTAV